MSRNRRNMSTLARGAKSSYSTAARSTGVKKKIMAKVGDAQMKSAGKIFKAELKKKGY